MTRLNRQWRLASRPSGMVQVTDFSYHEEPVPDLRTGQLLVRVLYVSFDPAMRAFLREGPSYVAPQQVGSVMRAFAVGQVADSARPDFRAGDFVSGPFGGERAWPLRARARGAHWLGGISPAPSGARTSVR